MNTNPLDFPGERFELELRNPNPRSSKTKDGPIYRVSFEVDQETYLNFMDAKTSGMNILCDATVYMEYAEPKPKTEKGGFGDYYARCWKMGTFFQVEVARALGTDEEFQAWTRLQPDHFTKQFSELKNGEGRCVFAHVPDLTRKFGKQNKAEFSGLPMLQNEQHLIQHSEGWAALRGKYATSQIGDPLLWAQNERDSHLHKWMAFKICELFGVSSRTMIPPEDFYKWAMLEGISKFLPAIVTSTGRS